MTTKKTLADCRRRLVELDKYIDVLERNAPQKQMPESSASKNTVAAHADWLHRQLLAIKPWRHP